MYATQVKNDDLTMLIKAKYVMIVGINKYFGFFQ